MSRSEFRIASLLLLGAACVVAMLVPGGERLSAADAATGDLRADMLARPLTPDLSGEGSVDATGPRAFRSIVANADNSMVQPFLFGQRNFDAVWDHEPVINPTIDGLGPMFNRTSCRECHSANGRGHPPQNVGDPMKSMLVRLSIPGADPHGGPNPVPNYGDQLQDRAVTGVPPEGQAIIRYEEVPGEFADGTPYSLRKPTLEFVNLGYGDLPAETLASPRVAPTVIGLGYLQAIPEETLRALEDPDDADGDGISGRVNMTWDAVTQTMMPGRFGWKANVPSLRHQSAGAALGDMGLTSPVFPNELCEPAQEECLAEAARIAEKSDAPDFLEELLTPTEWYMYLVAVPRQRNPGDPAVQRGEQLFRGAGCVGCHMPTLVTGTGKFPSLSNQQIHPFTDLLVHDMGEGLADNRPDFDAGGREWRTAPLWGIGLMMDVSGEVSYLHDGRARSIPEAILWHGGEAEGPREVFRNMSKDERDDLVTFLGSI